MKAISRYMEYKDDFFDKILLKIKNGIIKCGRYTFKIDKKKKIKLKGKIF